MTFEPVFIANCADPKRELEKAAAKAQISAKMLRITIEDVLFFTRTSDQPELTELKKSDLAMLTKEEFMTRPDLEIRQSFAITIEPIGKAPTYDFSLQVSPDSRELIFTLLKGSVLNKNPKFVDSLFADIQTKKAMMQLLSYAQEEERRNLEALLVNIEEGRPTERLHQIVLSKSFNADKRLINPRLTLHFQDSTTGTHPLQFKIVKSGTLLATFIKPRAGEAGRDCFGRFIPPKEPEKLPVNNLQFDQESIRLEETTERMNYFAQASGYLIFQKDSLSITKKLELTCASSKTTGSISGDKEIPTMISVKQAPNSLEEAVGEGISLEAQEIEVAGIVGNATQLIAKKVTINGQTHQGSTITAESASVDVHKGTIRAQDVTISRLEAGTVYAKNLSIQHVYGGRIYAQHIKIEFLHSNLHAFASESIEIGELVGEDNKFMITSDIGGGGAALSGPSDLQDLYKSTQEEIKLKARGFDQKVKDVNSAKSTMLRVKSMIEENRKNGLPIPPYLKEKLHEYADLINKTKELKEEIGNLQQKLTQLETEIHAAERATLKGYVVAKGGWRGYNEVRFKLLSPPRELFFAPKESHGKKVRLDDSHQVIIAQ